MHSKKLCIALLLCLSTAATAHAGVALLLEQPIGGLGRISGSGHAAIYLSHVCAESPTRLRRCRSGEDGVVISSYGRVDKYYWTAIPLVPYLYAVDDVREVPARVDAAAVMRLRDRYRRRYLESVAPDGPDHTMPKGHWNQLVGSNYERRIYVFEMESSPAQDDRLIQELNGNPNNQTQYNFFFRNCANFAEYVLNFYYPHSVHRSFTADLGLMTPKQTAKSFVSYAHHHKAVQFSAFILPQVPGKVRRSGKAYGVMEAIVKKKQYAIPLAVFQPWFAAGIAVTYFVRGRFNPERDCVELKRGDAVEALLRDTSPRPEWETQSARLVSASVHSADTGGDEKCVDGLCGQETRDVFAVSR